MTMIFNDSVQKYLDNFKPPPTMDHLMLSGIYWLVTCQALIDRKLKDDVVPLVKSLQAENGGFRPFIGHDPHLLYTYSAIQILSIYDALDQIDVEKCVQFIQSLVQPDGSVLGDDIAGEIDTRFSYCAVGSLSLLGRLHVINQNKIVQFIDKCRNFDGGFGSLPGSESHAGQIFCCVATLKILDRMDVVNIPLLSLWLSSRQLPNGGLNGRPEKKEDVCYAWWVLSALFTINKQSFISTSAVTDFILSCQDPETGGIADRQGDEPDPFHTFFGVAGLSLLGFPDLKPVDPVYCLPTSVVERITKNEFSLK